MNEAMTTPRRTRIKVCGMTDLAEALALVAMGVDALGCILVKASPRYVDVETVRGLAAQLPPFVDLVGVFMDEEASTVNDLAQACGLTMIQLHGNEPPDYCRAMVRPVVKAFRVRAEALPDLRPYQGLVKGFLLDTYRQEAAGGTGATFDWGLVQAMAVPGPLVLAGGLTPDNVAAAIHQLRPFAVDANSGVEISPGRKDLAKVSRLVAAVRQADMTAASEF